MPAPPRSLYAAVGDPITAKKWNDLLDWGKSHDLNLPPNLIGTTGPNGTDIAYVGDIAISHPFKVTVTAGYATVSAGYLDQDMPRIDHEAGGEFARLDGTAMDWLDSDVTAGRPPRLLIEAPGETLSFIALRVVGDEEPGNFWSLTDPESLTVVHVTTAEMAAQREENTLIGFQPLAALRWKANTLTHTTQIPRHNLQHAFRPGDGDRPGTHFFFAE